ncbi:unnamed protein product [Oikopleura dioica]|uniref:Uncharacterized protein n=1 Tax=Oikopleura dioica TaxID=34765 RepID=E4XRU1_OIKDI|nr:unnamed protein product [Oikopleura dioica]
MTYLQIARLKSQLAVVRLKLDHLPQHSPEGIRYRTGRRPGIRGKQHRILMGNCNLQACKSFYIR